MFYFQSTCWNVRVFDIIFRLNQLYLLLESKQQVFLLKSLSKISLHIFLKLSVLACCKNKLISSGKKFLTSERPLILFCLAAVLVGIMLGLTQSNKEDWVSKFSNQCRSHTAVLAVASMLYLGIILNQRSLSSWFFNDLNTITLCAES